MAWNNFDSLGSFGDFKGTYNSIKRLFRATNAGPQMSRVTSETLGQDTGPNNPSVADLEAADSKAKQEAALERAKDTRRKPQQSTQNFGSLTTGQFDTQPSLIG